MPPAARFRACRRSRFSGRASPPHIPVKPLVRFVALLGVCITGSALAFLSAAIVQRIMIGVAAEFCAAVEAESHLWYFHVALLASSLVLCCSRSRISNLFTFVTPHFLHPAAIKQ
jgi:hypothetical protein